MDESRNPLRDYLRAKQEVAAAVRAAQQLLVAQDGAEQADRCQELLVSLAEDRFNLAVVGQFKRGKSSLMNAVIGHDLLPTGLLPLTSAITTLCYGPQARAQLRRKGWVLEQEITLAQLAEYVTERGNPGNEKGVLEARVELPVPFLRRGLHFVDTPGVGSARVENTETTYAFLPQSDAVIFVTSVEAPLSETEEGFLRDIRQHVRKLFIVVNKMDLLADHERDEVLAYVRSGLARTLGAELHLYPLSARQALAAKLRGDDAGVEASGLAALETDLAAFLSLERGQTFLVSVLDRALRLLDGAPPASVTPRATAAESACPPDLQQSMVSLRNRLLAGELAPEDSAASILPAARGRFGEQIVASRAQLRRTPSPTVTSGGTCPICGAQSQALLDFFVEAQYALATAEDAQRAFAQERGFCRVHTWQFQPMTSQQGLSAGLGPLIETALGELRRITGMPREASAARIEALLSSSEGCAACRAQQEAGNAALAQFQEQIVTSDGRQRYERSAGLCLPHLRAVLAAQLPQEATSYLLRQQARRLEEISEDMRSYVLKRAALRRGLTHSEEEGAWRRALVQLVGERTAGK